MITKANEVYKLEQNAFEGETYVYIHPFVLFVAVILKCLHYPTLLTNVLKGLIIKY